MFSYPRNLEMPGRSDEGTHTVARTLIMASEYLSPGDFFDLTLYGRKHGTRVGLVTTCNQRLHQVAPGSKNCKNCN